MKKAVISISFLLLVSIPAFKNLVFKGGYTSHDLTHHVVRQISMSKLIKEGQFPPRWDADLNNGFGYPVFIFNYPLPAYIGDVFHRLGLSYVDSVKSVMLISLPLSAIGMYLFLYKWLKEKSQLPAILGAVFYLYAPIRFINVYVSASVGGALALAIIPFLFWSITKQVQEKTPSSLPRTGLLFALLILSHNITALIFAPIIILFALLISFQSLNFQKSLRSISLSLILGLGLSAYFWIPAIASRGILRYDSLMEGQYLKHFPSLYQLIRSPWGYGMSNLGVDQDGMSFQIGLAHLLVTLLSIKLLFIKKNQKAVILFLLIFITSVFLMLKASSPVWQYLPLLQLVQYQFRILAITVFSASVLVALLIKNSRFKLLFFAPLLFLLLYANRNHLRINEMFNPGEDYYLNLKTTTASWSEHLPQWSAPASTESPGKIIITEGSGKIYIEQNKSALVSAKIQATTPITVQFNQVYYPGWVFLLNNKPINFTYLESNSNGMPVISIPKGDHLFIGKLTKTNTHKFAEGLTLLSIISSVLIITKKTKKLS